ncbi:MAG: MraY family glycosyltransferase [Candidatus Caenarcaniphilales bacterium]|nr:MraY family glycosyltransferase [Candidatus Caenarcaniphilales bacterium]
MQLPFLPELKDSQVLGFAIALISSLILTPLICNWAVKLKLLDKPGGRHIHKNPVPRLGGVSIYLSLIIASLLFLIVYGRYSPGGIRFELLGILAGGTLIFVVGLLDDLSPLPASLKLAAQILSAVVAWICDVKVKFLANPLFLIGLSETRVVELDPIVSFIVTIGWLVLITNALNLVDGLDGLAGGVAMITALSLWAILLDGKINQPAGALLSATLAGAVMGFLRLNYSPARIFLGDSGAYFLGFTLGATAVASLSGNPNTATVGFLVLVAFSFPLFETMFTIGRRFIKGKPIMQPDSDHIHHRILKAGVSPKLTMFIIWITCMLLGLVASLGSSGSQKRYIILTLMIFSLFLLSSLWHRGSLPGEEAAELSVMANGVEATQLTLSTDKSVETEEKSSTASDTKTKETQKNE